MDTLSAPDRSDRGRWLPGYLALALIWGSSFLLIKIGVGELHPVYVTLGRVGTGVLFLLPVLLATRSRLPRDLKTWGHVAVIALVGVVIPFTLFGYAEQRVSSVLAGIWNATTPLFVLPIATLVFHTEPMTSRRIAGLVTGFMGVLVVLGVWQGVGGTQFTGQLMCLGATLCYGVAIPYQRRFLTGMSRSGIAVPAAQLMMALAQLTLLAPLLAGAPPAPTSLSGGVIAGVASLGALGTGLAFVLNFRVIRYAGASVASTVTYLVPIVATVIGVIGLGEPLSWRQPTGALIVLAGVAISQGVLRLPSRAPTTSYTADAA